MNDFLDTEVAHFRSFFSALFVTHFETLGFQ